MLLLTDSLSLMSSPGISILADNVTITNNEFYVNGFDDSGNDVIDISEADDVSVINNKIYFNVETNGTF